MNHALSHSFTITLHIGNVQRSETQDIGVQPYHIIHLKPGDTAIANVLMSRVGII